MGAPRRAAQRTKERPAGPTAILASALIIILGRCGVDFTPDEAVVLVSALTLIAEWVGARVRR